MNKQIEEMREDLIEIFDEEYEKRRIITADFTAVKLSAKGYRKQIEGENISQMHPSDEFICEKCGLIVRDCCRYEIDEDDGDEICYEFPYRFCPRCGMKVKGEQHERED